MNATGSVILDTSIVVEVESAMHELMLDPQKPPLLLLGAGASDPLPTANELKRWLIDAALEITGLNKNQPLKKHIYAIIDRPFVTLEAVFSLFAYRLGNDFPADKILENTLDFENIGLSGPMKSYKTTRLALLIAAIRQFKASALGPVITTNFDICLAKAHDIVGLGYSIVTLAQIDNNRSLTCPLDLTRLRNLIVPAHGTIGTIDKMAKCSPKLAVEEDQVKRKYMGAFTGGFSDPTTVFARGLAKPFTEDYSIYLKKLLQDATAIVTFGYRGSDEYDFNLILEELLNEQGKCFSSKFQWISYAGDGTDLSSFVQEKFSEQIVHGDLKKHLQKKLSSIKGRIPGNARKNAVPENAEIRGFLKRNIQEQLLSLLKKHWQDGPKRDQVSEVLYDLESNVPGAWAALEHYYLESIGFEQNKISAFGGSRTPGQSMFCGVDFARIIEGQRCYRSEQSDPISEISTAISGINILHQRSASVFSALANEAHEAVTNGLVGRYIERALVLVARAAASDYQGLILRNRAIRAGKIGLNQPFVTELAQRAIIQFSDCKHSAELAAQSVGRDPEVVEIQDIDELTGWRKWQTIAMDNIPRARELFDRKTALEEYLSVIELRERQYRAMTGDVPPAKNPSGGNAPKLRTDFAPAHLPQLMLRISEYFKCAFNIKKGISDKHSDKIKYWSTRSFELIEDYFRFTSVPNHLIIALLEALSYYATENADGDTAKRIGESMTRHFRGKLQYRRCEEFTDNWRAQIEKLRQHNSDDSNKLKIISKVLENLSSL